MITTTALVTIWAPNESEAQRIANSIVGFDYVDGPNLLEVPSVDGALPFTFTIEVDPIDVEALGIPSD